MNTKFVTLAAASCLVTPLSFAHEGTNKPINPDSHAPIGVMGDHLHRKGEVMVSYRYMQMHMEDNLQGSNNISNEQIATTVTNPNGPPPTIRVVPQEMTTDMHMVGVMYAPSDTVTLMAMVTYLEKTMDHVTFAGGMGTAQLGEFTTESSGLGDTKVAALWSMIDGKNHKMHLNLGLSLPTGSITEEDDVLSPMNTTPTLRLPYAMQLGSGTYDLMPGVTYTGNSGKLGWGGQYMATLLTSENDEGYTLGDKHMLTGWSSYRVAPWLSTSVRLSYMTLDEISGADDQIQAPVTTADPANYGGERLDLAVGVNLVGQEGALRGHRLALEYLQSIDEDANGVHLEMQDMLTVGYQYAF